MKIQHLTNPQSVLMEIERGGSIEPEILNQMQDQEFDNRQGDLFGDKIPTLEPHVPKGYERVGRIGAYVMLHKTTKPESIPDEQLYVLLDKFKVIGWVGLVPTNSKNIDYPSMMRGIHYDLHGEGLQIVGVQVDRAYAGQNLGIRMYEFLLQHVCDFLVSDLTHTAGGAAIWRKLMNSRRFDVHVYDNERNLSRKRWAGKDWKQVYKQWHLIPWVTLKGKADQILRGDDE